MTPEALYNATWVPTGIPNGWEKFEEVLIWTQEQASPPRLMTLVKSPSGQHFVISADHKGGKALQAWLVL